MAGLDTIDLNDGERRLLDEAKDGEPIVLDKAVPVSAEVVRGLLLGLAIRKQVFPLAPVGLRLTGATIVGRLRLDDIKAADGGPSPALEFRDCRFKSGFSGAHGCFSRLTFIGCGFSGADKDEKGRLLPTVDLTGASVRSDLSMREARPRGANLWIRAPRIRIGGHLDLSGSHLKAPPDPGDRFFSEPPFDALDIAGAEVRGDFYFLCESMSRGRMSLRGARIGGDVWMSGATLKNPGGDALFFQGATVDGLVVLQDRADLADGSGPVRQFTCVGGLNMVAAEFKRDLRLRRVVVQGKASLSDLTVGNDLIFGAHVSGRVNMPGCRIGGTLDLSDLTLGASSPGLNLTEGRIGRSLRLIRSDDNRRPAHRLLAARHAPLASVSGAELVETLWDYETSPACREPAQVGFLVKGDSIYRLDGRVGILEEAVNRFGQTVAGVETAIEYLRLHCTYGDNEGSARPVIAGESGLPPFLALPVGAAGVDFLNVELDKTESAETGSAETESGGAESAATGSAQVEPGKTDSVETDTAATDAGEAEAGETQVESAPPSYPIRACVLEVNLLRKYRFEVMPKDRMVQVLKGEKIGRSVTLAGAPRFEGPLILRPKPDPPKPDAAVAGALGVGAAGTAASDSPNAAPPDAAQPQVAGSDGAPPGVATPDAAPPGVQVPQPWVTAETVAEMKPYVGVELATVRDRYFEYLLSNVSLRGTILLSNLSCAMLDDNAGRHWGSQVDTIQMDHFVYDRATWVSDGPGSRDGRLKKVLAEYWRMAKRVAAEWFWARALGWAGVTDSLRLGDHWTPWQIKRNWIYQQFDTSHVPSPERYRIRSSEYRPQPFEQAIRVARAEGRDDFAVEFEMLKQRIEWRLFNRRVRWPLAFIAIFAAYWWLRHVGAEDDLSGYALVAIWALMLFVSPIHDAIARWLPGKIAWLSRAVMAAIFVAPAVAVYAGAGWAGNPLHFFIALLIFAALRLASCVSHGAMRFMFGYLRRPLRAVCTLIGAFLIGWMGVHLANARQLLVIDTAPVAGLVGEDEQLAVIGTQRERDRKSLVSHIACRDTISEPLYALDVLIPLIDLREENRCEVGRAATAAKPPHGPEKDSGFFGLLAAADDLTIDNESFWAVMKALYAIAGWFIVSLSILTFAHINRVSGSA